MKVKSESEVESDTVQPHGLQPTRLLMGESVGFSRQEYWSGVPLLSLERQQGET